MMQETTLKKEPITVEKENEQTSKAKEMAEKDKEKPYVSPLPYKPLIPYPL